MAERLQYDDLLEHAGCKHHLEVDVKDAIRTFFTSPPSATFTLGAGATVLAQLVAHLNATVPTVTWNAAKVIRAIRAMVEDEEE